VLNVGINADPGDLVPWSLTNAGRGDTEEMLYQAMAISENGEIESVLYKEYKLSEDGKYLDVFFYDYIHDSAGNPLKASDVVFSFDRALASGVARSVSAIANKAEVLDEYSVRFYLTKTLFVGELANFLSQFYIVTRAAYEASPDGMATNPVGTGPNKLTRYTSGYMMTFEKVPDYWQTNDALTPDRLKANIKTINFYIITEPSQMTMALENGSIDMSWRVSNDDTYLFDTGGPQSEKYRIYKVPDNQVTQIWLNCSKTAATGGSVDLRRAIYYAINSQVILQSVYNGSGVLTYDIGRPANSDYSKSWETEDNYYHYDLEKAKEYLAKSGYRPGQLTLTLLCESSAIYSNAAVVIQGFLSAIGINVKINAVQPALMTAYREDPTTWDIQVSGQGAANYVTDAYSTAMLATRFAWGGTQNFIIDDKLQELIGAAMLESSHNSATVNALHQYMVENAYGRGVVNFSNNYIVPKDCTSIVLSYKRAIMPGACTYTN
jgi:ABC-type transport system substrate-binding protein